MTGHGHVVRPIMSVFDNAVNNHNSDGIKYKITDWLVNCVNVLLM